MKVKTIISILMAALLLIACNENKTQEEQQKEIKDIKQLVNDYTEGNIKNETASITSEVLIVTDSKGKQTIYNLPEDEFFVSIAPFINKTHPCENHSLTGCQGELVNELFEIYIQDSSGKVIINDSFTSQENGFIDLWLPRDQVYYIKIKHNGMTAESQISTFIGDGTCITTMQLL